MFIQVTYRSVGTGLVAGKPLTQILYISLPRFIPFDKNILREATPAHLFVPII
jgi:hypothetical protein